MNMAEWKEPAAEAVADPAWAQLRREAAEMAQAEPMLAGLLHESILRHVSLERALAAFLAGKLVSHDLSELVLLEIFTEALETAPAIGDAVRLDLEAVLERDPAARSLAIPFLYFKGFHALQAYRVAHVLWRRDRGPLAQYLQSRIAETFNVDIHPAARIGRGILIDHGTGVVIGETAVVGDNVSMLHAVTLGGTGKSSGDRHPKVGRGVMIGAGAKILGNVHVGDGAKIAAGSVVLSEVPAHTTVAGIPAKVVGRPAAEEPARTMDQTFELDFCI